MYQSNTTPTVNSKIYGYYNDFYFKKESDFLYLLNPANGQNSVSNGALRLTTMFWDLLDQQFPITSIRQRMQSRFPVDFAGRLSIHINHLNRSLKEITGKTTSQLIAERINKEASLLLQYTDWNICEIGYCLGFEEGPHFINFFKKNVKLSPAVYRKMIRANKMHYNGNLNSL